MCVRVCACVRVCVFRGEEGGGVNQACGCDRDVVTHRACSQLWRLDARNKCRTAYDRQHHCDWPHPSTSANQ